MNFLVIGCGRVGSRLAATLARRGDAVTVVDTAAVALDRFGAQHPGTRITGDGCDRDVLARAGIDRADGLAAVTGSDEVNAVVARLAATLFGVPRVVARLYDPAKAEIYRRLGVQTIAPITWGAERLAELLTHAELAPIASLGSGQVELVDAMVPALLHGRPAAELTIAGETQVVALTRHGVTSLVASQATLLEAGDVAHLAVTATTGLEALLGRH
jgi:trk system potassium uptake protein